MKDNNNNKLFKSAQISVLCLLLRVMSLRSSERNCTRKRYLKALVKDSHHSGGLGQKEEEGGM